MAALVPTTATYKTFVIVSLGCAKNTVDSEAMEQLLLASGHRRADDASSADLLIVNTCGFIESAKQESIDMLLQLGARKRSDQKLIATGCLVERYSDELVQELPLATVTSLMSWALLPELGSSTFTATVTEPPGSVTLG